MKIPTWLAVVIIAVVVVGGVWYVMRDAGMATRPEDINTMIEKSAIGKGNSGGMPGTKTAPMAMPPAGTRAKTPQTAPAPAHAR